MTKKAHVQIRYEVKHLQLNNKMMNSKYEQTTTCNTLTQFATNDIGQVILHLINVIMVFMEVKLLCHYVMRNLCGRHRDRRDNNSLFVLVAEQDSTVKHDGSTVTAVIWLTEHNPQRASFYYVSC